MSDRWRAPIAAGVTFAVVGLAFSLAYLAQDHVTNPLGWDSPFYVWRTAAVGVDGLDRLGGVRPATPLLFHSLASLLGIDALTVAALAPPLVAGAAALAGAGLLRAALGLSAWWVPVAGSLLWLGFGHPGMVREQPDNVLNAALTLAALAAAVVHVRSGRAWLPLAALLAAAGLAHWPFFVFAVAVTVSAAITGGGPRRGAVIAAAAGACAVVAAGFLWRPPGAWTTPRLAGLRALLQDRFLRRAGDPHRAIPLPLAGGGLWVLGRMRPGGEEPGRRMFVHAMGAWLALTALGLLAQVAGVPVAGLRLLNHLFPLTLLAAVLVWWSASRVGSPVARFGVAAVALGLAAAVAVPFLAGGRSWYEPQAVRQAATAGRWALRATEGPVVFSIDPPRGPLTADRWRNTVLAAIPPELGPRTRVRLASAAEDPSAPAGGVLVAIEAYDRRGHAGLVLGGAPQITKHVAAVVHGFAPGDAIAEPEPSVPGPRADLRTRTILMVLILGGVLLFAAGAGWSVALPPADPVLRWCLAPALGCAATILLGLGWAAAGLPLEGAAGGGPLALAAAAGSAVALARARP